MFLCIWLPEMVSFSVAGFGWPRKSCRQNRFTTTIYYLPTYYLEATNHPSSSASSITMATSSYSSTRLQYIGRYIVGSEFKVYLSEAAAASSFSRFPYNDNNNNSGTRWLTAGFGHQSICQEINSSKTQVGKMILKWGKIFLSRI